MYTHILVALDGSPHAETILPHVAALATRFAAHVTLLHVSAPPIVLDALPAAVGAGPGPAVFIEDATQLAETERAASERYLDEVATRLADQGLQVTHAQATGPAAEAIVAVAGQQGADLIALTSHGREGMGRLLLGSVTEAVLRHAPCPILALRVDDDAQTTA